MRRIISTTKLIVTAIAVAAGSVGPSAPAWALESSEPDQPQPVSTSDQVEAEQSRLVAQDEYLQGHYNQAIEGFQHAYSLSPDPTDLYNIGRIHEEIGNLDDALSYYEQFSRQPRLSLEERSLAADHIRVLRVLVTEKSRATETEPSASAPTVVVKPPPKESNQTIAAPIDQPEPKVNRGLIVAGSTMIGLGTAASIAGGIGFGIRAQQDSRSIEQLSSGRNPDRLSLTDAENINARGTQSEVLQITFIAAGALVAVTGVGLLIAERIIHKRAGLRALAPTVGNRRIALHALWRF